MIRVHSSFHKCLTLFYLRVMGSLYTRLRPWSKRFAHYESIQGLFYNNLDKHRVVSVNGFAVDIERLGEAFRLVRFVRDPRDLIVSGYHYHKRGAEPWFRHVSPTPAYWAAINANVPAGMPPGVSYAEYLSGLNVEDGLLAEIEFRRFHLESLRQWPQDERIRVYRYEDILGNEAAVFADIFCFYELSLLERKLASRLADFYALRRRGNDAHIRNPQPGQWHELFTQRVENEFNASYGDSVALLGY